MLLGKQLGERVDLGIALAQQVEQLEVVMNEQGKRWDLRWPPHELCSRIGRGGRESRGVTGVRSPLRLLARCVISKAEPTVTLETQEAISAPAEAAPAEAAVQAAEETPVSRPGKRAAQEVTEVPGAARYTSKLAAGEWPPGVDPAQGRVIVREAEAVAR